MISGEAQSSLKLTYFTPVQGVVNSKVTIIGSGFDRATAVTFNNNAAVFYVESNTKLTAWVPNDNASGLLKVWKQFQSATSGSRFNLTPQEGHLISFGEVNQRGQLDHPKGTQSVLGLFYGSDHSMFLGGDNAVKSWGSLPNDDELPAKILSLGGGSDFSLALFNDGSVEGWGENGSGQITVPPALPKGIQIAAGYYHGLMIDAKGLVYGWGRDDEGQVRKKIDHSNPRITGANNMLEHIISIKAGDTFSMALRSDGKLIGWGSNDFGQLGSKGPKINVDPRIIRDDLIAITAGSHHVLGIERGTQKVVAWGGNGHGQCNVPTEALSDIIAIAAGESFSLALRSDGKVIGWGEIFSEQSFEFESIEELFPDENVGNIVSGKQHFSFLVPELKKPDLLKDLNKNYAIIDGKPIELAIQVTGSSPMTYQWYKDNKSINTSNKHKTKIALGNESNTGEYKVIASNPYGKVTSRTAIVKKGQTVKITKSFSENFNLTEGDLLELAIQVTGSSPIKYEWYKDGKLITYKNKLVIKSGKPADTGLYKVIVSNPYGSVSHVTTIKFSPHGGLVAYYPFNGNARDESGNRNHGTVNGAVLVTDRHGEIASAYRFDGSTTISIPHSRSISFNGKNNPVTFSIWVNAEKVGTHIFGKRSGGANYQFDMYSGSFEFRGDGFTGGLLDPEKAELNEWVHLAGSWDGKISKFYKNGELKLVNSDSNAGLLGKNNTADLVIGGSASFTKFRGLIDDFRMYDRALSVEDVMMIYALESPPTPVSLNEGLVAYYPFNGNANDESENENHGTVNGAVLVTDRHGEIASAYRFDGSTTISIPHSRSISFNGKNNPVTFSIWVNAEKVGTHIFGKRSGGANYQFDMYSGSFEFRGDGFTGGLLDPEKAELNEWVHLAGSWDGKISKFYKNGELKLVNSDSNAGLLGKNNTADLVIGGSASFTKFRGLIDDFRMYDRALSISEVIAIYSSESNPPIKKRKPKITKSFSENFNLTEGDLLELAIQVTGSSPIKYKWYKDDVIINITNENKLVIKSGKLADTGLYKVIVSNPYGSVSHAATVKFSKHGEVPLEDEGLVAYYPFNGNANDESGNGNDGVIEGNPSFTESAVLLDGKDDYIQLPKKLIPESGDFTVSVFFTENNSEDLIELISQGASPVGFYIGRQNGNIRATDSKTNSGVSFPKNNTFSSVTLVVNESNSTIYVNGLVQSSFAGIHRGITGTETRIGRQFGMSEEFFKGEIHDVMIYNRALSESEVAALYELKSAPPVTQEILINTFSKIDSSFAISFRK